jgi:hypothetical protein
MKPTRAPRSRALPPNPDESGFGSVIAEALADRWGQEASGGLG